MFGFGFTAMAKRAVPLTGLFVLSACANPFARPPAPDCPPPPPPRYVEKPRPKPQWITAADPALKATRAYDARTDEPLTQLPDGRLIVGGVEHVAIDPPGISYTARVDSGANTSSLDARNLVVFERDEERWVRFDLRPKDGVEEPVSIEKPVERFVLISQTNSPKPDRRPVVKMLMSIGGQENLIEFTLRDRSSMTHAILLGREYLLDRAVIDISRNYIQAKK